VSISYAITQPSLETVATRTNAGTDVVTIARHQLVALRRQRVLTVMTVTMLAMTALAGVIGWSSHQTIVRVYDVALKLLAEQGKPAPPNPIGLKPVLSLLLNMVVYIPLIGALLALVLGHLTIADDETSGLGRLLFSRKVARSSYLIGKLLAAAVVLAAISAACMVVSVLALLIVNGSMPSIGDVGRLIVFYAFSWMYLMTFALVGIVAALIARRRSMALLSAIGVWLVATFVVPQITSGLRPTTSLNPLTEPVGTSQAFFRFTAHGRAWSLAEQYKAASGRLLQTASPESTAATLVRVLPVAGALVLLVLVASRLVQRHDYSRSMNGE
jgi:ABC-type transport system involved in multi-copper enzyme maturation permease subunit